jgi:hypothetical protein
MCGESTIHVDVVCVFGHRKRKQLLVSVVIRVVDEVHKETRKILKIHTMPFVPIRIWLVFAAAGA